MSPGEHDSQTGWCDTGVSGPPINTQTGPATISTVHHGETERTLYARVVRPDGTKSTWQAAYPDLPDLPSDQNTRIQFHAQDPRVSSPAKDGVDVDSDPDAPGDEDDVGYEESSLASQPCEPVGSDGSVTPRASPCAVDFGRDTPMAGYRVQGDGNDSDLDVLAAIGSDTQAAPASALIHHESEAGGSTSLHQMTSITTDPAQPPTVPQTHLKLPPLPPKQYRFEHLSQTESKSIPSSPESLSSHRSESSLGECSLTISVPGESVTAVYRLPREWLQGVCNDWAKIRSSPANSGVLFRFTYPDDSSTTGSVSEEVRQPTEKHFNDTVRLLSSHFEGHFSRTVRPGEQPAQK